MLDDLVAIYDLNLAYAHRLTADLPDAQWAVQPAPGMNHPAWVIGHLARSCDVVLSLLGEPELSPQWNELFGLTSRPLPDRARYPDKQALLAALDAGHDAVKRALPAADPALLAAAPPFEQLRDRFKTLNRFVVYLVVTHEPTHLGQLSAWRRVQGLPAV